jgi:hypothetical protein
MNEGRTATVEGDMVTVSSGPVLVTATIENLRDVYELREGLIAREQIHSLEVSNPLVNLRSSILLMPSRLIQKLGLLFSQSRKARTGKGNGVVRIYSAVRLTIQGRDCVTDVVEHSEDNRVIIGEVLLHVLDFVIDFPNRRLIGNPEHGGEHILEMY